MSRDTYDQLGLVRDVTFFSTNGVHMTLKDGPPGYLGPLQASTNRESAGGYDVLVVKAFLSSRIGEAALYAAFLDYNSGENIWFRTSSQEFGLYEIPPDVIPPHMSAEEINKRWARVRGAEGLTDQDKQTVTLNALLVTTHLHNISRTGYEQTELDL